MFSGAVIFPQVDRAFRISVFIYVYIYIYLSVYIYIFKFACACLSCEFCEFCLVGAPVCVLGFTFFCKQRATREASKSK